MQRFRRHHHPFNVAQLEHFEDAARRKLEEIQDAAREKMKLLRYGTDASKRAVYTVNRYSHRKPWVMIGLFSMIAWLFGYISGHKH